MNRSRAFILALLLGGPALPVYATEDDGDAQSADAGYQSGTDTAENATNDQRAAAPAVDFSKLDVGGTNAGQESQVHVSNASRFSR